MRNQKGFTLIEMLVVIAIVGLLSSVVVVGLGGARQKARDARRVADIRQLQNWLEVEYEPVGGYPDGTALPAGAPITVDPQNVAYLYTSAAATPETYELGACLEDADNVPGGGSTGCSITCTVGTLYCMIPE